MKLVLFIFCFLPAAVFAQKELLVKGKINGLKENSLIYITDANTTPTDTFARGRVKNGEFTVKGSMREAILVTINFEDAKKRTPLFLDNGKFNITGDINDLQTLKVTGSATQADFQAYQEIFGPLIEKYFKIAQLAKTTGPTDSLRIEAARTYTTIQEKIEMFLPQHLASPVSPFLLLVTSQLSDDVSVMEKRYISLEVPAQKNYYGRYLKDLIDNAKVGAVGSDAIDFTQNDVNGQPVSLSSFKGKYVLVDFWASWCGPCRMENPNVVNTFQEFKGKNFTILGVSLDKQKDPWLKAISDDNLAWTHVSDLKFWSNEIAVKYRVQSIPQNFLIDPNGKIVAKNLRGPALKEKLCELLGCK